ncbi:MAG: hypothetical protein WDZ70_01405, partial [Candidatus Paceibacterota bacterium]
STHVYIMFYDATNNDVEFVDSSNNWSSSQVGIGTENPLAKLTIQGDGTDLGKTFSLLNSSGLENFTFLDKGRFGIGTSSPMAQLSIKGTGTTTSSIPLTITNGDDTDLFRILDNGSVGLGATTTIASANMPAGSLVVDNGALCVDNGGFNCDDSSRTAGTIYANNTTVGGLDIAERYQTNDDTLEAGELVSLDSSTTTIPGLVKRAVQPDDVLGVISTQPGITLGMDIGHSVAVALKGRVPVKVTGENGSISIGDRLTLSSTTAGHATKAATSTRTVGIALEPFHPNNPSDEGTIEIFVEREYTFNNNDFYVDSETGNIGIGTTSPEYDVHVIGDVAAQSFINISTASQKKNVSELSDSERTSLMDSFRALKPVFYDYINEETASTTDSSTASSTASTTPRHFGFIAEDAPLEVLSASGKGVDLYKLTTFTIAAVQENDRRLSRLEDVLGGDDFFATSTATSTESAVSIITSTSTVETTATTSTSTALGDLPEDFATSTIATTTGNLITTSSQFINRLAGVFSDIGIRIEENVVRFSNIFAQQVRAFAIEAENMTADVLNARIVYTKYIEVEGITTKDRATGEYYCIVVENGEITNLPGKCDEQTTSSTDSTDDSTSTTTDNTSTTDTSSTDTTTDGSTDTTSNDTSTTTDSTSDSTASSTDDGSDTTATSTDDTATSTDDGSTDDTTASSTDDGSTTDTSTDDTTTDSGSTDDTTTDDTSTSTDDGSTTDTTTDDTSTSDTTSTDDGSTTDTTTDDTSTDTSTSTDEV